MEEQTAIEMLTRYVVIGEENYDISNYVEFAELIYAEDGTKYIKLGLNDFPEVRLLGNYTYVQFLDGLIFEGRIISGVEVIIK
jgi:hypothetical protein